MNKGKVGAIRPLVEILRLC